MYYSADCQSDIYLNKLEFTVFIICIHKKNFHVSIFYYFTKSRGYRYPNFSMIQPVVLLKILERVKRMFKQDLF